MIRTILRLWRALATRDLDREARVVREQMMRALAALRAGVQR